MVDAGDYPKSELGDPIYQSIDHSRFVPLLTAALQDAVAKIEEAYKRSPYSWRI